jgi:hypothetical protein
MNSFFPPLKKNGSLPYVLVLASALVMAACSPNPDKINEKIESGKAVSALSAIEERLAANPNANEAAVWNMLAAKARMAICVERQCAMPSTSASTTIIPNELKLLENNLSRAPDSVSLGQDQPTLHKGDMMAQAITAYGKLPNQPHPLLVLRAAAPANMAPIFDEALFARAREAARNGENKEAAAILEQLSIASSLSPTIQKMAAWQAALITNNSALAANYQTALRDVGAVGFPAAAWGLLPHALRANTGEPAQALSQLPGMLSLNQIGPLSNQNVLKAVAEELAQIASKPELQRAWQTGWDEKNNGPIDLVFMRMSLRLAPDQPAVWSKYLPALVAAAQKGQDLPELTDTFQASSLSGPTQTMLADKLIEAAGKLATRPGMAAPLLELASQMKLSSAQQVALDKMAHEYLMKAAAAKDITATIALATARPAAAANDRQQVVPLLVESIRTSLKTSQFNKAVSVSELLNQGLGLDVELAPLILEEFSAQLKLLDIDKTLQSDTANILLQPSSSVALDLGPIFGFMQSFFASRPEVLTMQLNTIVSGARGVYGPASAMYRLQSFFPLKDQPMAQMWLSNAIIAAVIEDNTLNASKMMELIGKLTQVHPTLPISSLVETALNRSDSLESSRNIWNSSISETRAVMRSLRPQFVALMRGIDGMEQNRYGVAASAFAELTEPSWRSQAMPYLSQIHERLVNIAGVYVPLSVAPDVPTAVIKLSPEGLHGGSLDTVKVTWISQLGNQIEQTPHTLLASPAAVKTLTLSVPIDLDTSTLKLTPATLSQSPQAASLGEFFGNFTALKIKSNNASSTTVGNASRLMDGIIDGKRTASFIRALNNLAEPLRPDGTYLMTTHLRQNLTDEPSGGESILPNGSILTLQTAPTTQPTPPINNGLSEPISAETYPVLGTIKHPSTENPLSFTGFYDSLTQTTYFSFTYLLPSSMQTVKAGVKCQTLTGSITCGAYHLHSPRLVYATLVRGQQTQESLTEETAQRTKLNISAMADLLAVAQQTMPEIPSVTEVKNATQRPIVKAITTSDSNVISKSLVSGSLPSNMSSSPSKTVSSEDDQDEAMPNVTESISKTNPTPTTIIIRPDDNVSRTVPVGVFIHKTSAQSRPEPPQSTPIETNSSPTLPRPL